MAWQIKSPSLKVEGFLFGFAYRAYIYYRLGRIYEAMKAKDEMRAAFEQVLALSAGDEEIEGYARQALGQ